MRAVRAVAVTVAAITAVAAAGPADVDDTAVTPATAKIGVDFSVERRHHSGEGDGAETDIADDVAYFYEEEELLAIFVPCRPCSALMQHGSQLSDHVSKLRLETCSLCLHQPVLGLNECTVCGRVIQLGLSSSDYSRLAWAGDSPVIDISVSVQRQQYVSDSNANYQTEACNLEASTNIPFLVEKRDTVNIIIEDIPRIPWIEWQSPRSGEMINATYVDFVFTIHNIQFVDYNDAISINGSAELESSKYFVRFNDVQHSDDPVSTRRLPLVNTDSRVVRTVRPHGADQAASVRTVYNLSSETLNNEGSGFIRLSVVKSDDEMVAFSSTRAFEIIPGLREIEGFRTYRSSQPPSVCGDGKCEMLGAVGKTLTHISHKVRRRIHVMHAMGGPLDGSQNIVFQRWNLLNSWGSHHGASCELTFSLMWVCTDSSSNGCEMNEGAKDAVRQHEPHITVGVLPALKVPKDCWKEGYVNAI
jgi:hypothetical protein